MSCRDDLLNLFSGGKLDRIPVSPFIHVNYVKAFFGGVDVDVIDATVEVYRHFGFDMIHRNCTPAYDDVIAEGDGWKVRVSVEENGKDQTTTTVVHTPKGDLRQIWQLNWVSEYDAEASPVEFLIKDERDLDLIMEFQPPVGEIDTSPISRAVEAVGEDGVTAPWVQGAFNHVAYFFRSPDQLMMDALLNPEFYYRLMTFYLERNKRIISRFIAAGTPVLSYAGNIASGKMVSEPFYREFILPYEQELIAFVQSNGAHVLYHNCGYASNLFSCYRELGTHAYESLTPPPYGDTILEHALQMMGDETLLLGNLDQIEFLRKASPEQIRAKVFEVMSAVKDRGRFILATTDYFHEDTSRESIKAIADAAREFNSNISKQER